MSKYLDQWRGKLDATEEIELSTGPAVIRTSVSLLDLAAAGRIPVTLLSEFEEAGRKAKGKKGNPADLPKMLPALNAVAIAAFIDPPLSEEGGDDSLPVGAIPFNDKLAVFLRLNRGADQLRPFRGEPAEFNGATHSGDDVPLPAVATAEYPG
jgi:hypothetical protein